MVGEMVWLGLLGTLKPPNTTTHTTKLHITATTQYTTNSNTPPAELVRTTDINTDMVYKCYSAKGNNQSNHKGFTMKTTINTTATKIKANAKEMASKTSAAIKAKLLKEKIEMDYAEAINAEQNTKHSTSALLSAIEATIGTERAKSIAIKYFRQELTELTETELIQVIDYSNSDKKAKLISEVGNVSLGFVIGAGIAVALGTSTGM